MAYEMRISDWSSDVCSSDLWGGGWLAMLGKNFGFGHGHVDFAGSSVVHLTGGVLALVGAKIIGPRLARKSVGSGKSVSVRVDLGGRRYIYNTSTQTQMTIKRQMNELEKTIN